MKRWIIGGMIVLTSLNVALLLGICLECSPIAKNWNAAIEGHCVNPIILPYLSGAISSAADIFILVLPMHSLLNLNTTFARRMRVMAVFGLGLL